jgi:hypothetical protein
VYSHDLCNTSQNNPAVFELGEALKMLSSSAFARPEVEIVDLKQAGAR